MIPFHVSVFSDVRPVIGHVSHDSGNDEEAVFIPAFGALDAFETVFVRHGYAPFLYDLDSSAKCIRAEPQNSSNGSPNPSHQCMRSVSRSTRFLRSSPLGS